MNVTVGMSTTKFIKNTYINNMKSVLAEPVDGGLLEQLIIQNCSLHILIADSILKSAIDLRTTPMSMEDLEHLNFADPVHKELCHSAVQSHQNTTRLLERTHIAADQMIGDSFCECLELNKQGKNKERKILKTWIIQLEHIISYFHNLSYFNISITLKTLQVNRVK